MRPNTLYLEASIAVIIAIAALAVGVLVAWLIARSIERRKQEKLELEAKDLISQAQEQASQSLLEAKDEALKITRQAEIELAHRRSELNKEDDRLVKRREELDHRFDQMQQREAALNKRQSSVDRRANEIETLYADRLAELQRVAGMTAQEARDELLQDVEKTARADMARMYGDITESIRLR